MNFQTPCHLTRAARRSLAAKGFPIAFATWMLIGTGLLPVVAVNGQGLIGGIEPKVVLRLDARTVLRLHERFRDYADAIPAADTWGMEEVLAFEENPHFACLWGDSTKVLTLPSDAPSSGKAPRFQRRIVLLKPSTFVINDWTLDPLPDRIDCRPRWELSCRPEISFKDQRVREIKEDGGVLWCETLLPEEATTGTILPRGLAAGARQPLRVIARLGTPQAPRFMHVLHVAGSGEGYTVRSRSVSAEGELQLTLQTAGRVYQLTLPTACDAAGTIAVSETGGQTLLPSRPLPSGILPHGKGGVQLLERWDSAYRENRRPGWDTGRPSSDLRQAVESGTLKRCRAVEFGCGTGTNAIYLAQQGFDVTAIDLAPTALARAEEKARAEGVRVRWVLADVLAPPPLEPFDLVLRSGLLSRRPPAIRRGVSATVQRLTHPGSQVLIQAGNANEERQSGPPRVKEEELRGLLVRLRVPVAEDDTFRHRRSQRPGALAWSVLLRRK